MKMPDVKYAIPAETLTSTISALEFARDRYEQDAAALFGAALVAAKTEQGEAFVKLSLKLGQENLEQADKTANLVDFYLSL